MVLAFFKTSGTANTWRIKPGQQIAFPAKPSVNLKVFTCIKTLPLACSQVPFGFCFKCKLLDFSKYRKWNDVQNFNRVLLNNPASVKAGNVQEVIPHYISLVWDLGRLTLINQKHPSIHRCYSHTNKGYLQIHFPKYINIIQLVTRCTLLRFEVKQCKLNSYFLKCVFAQQSYGVDIKLTFLRTSFSCRWSGSSLPEYTSLWSFVD